MPLPDCLLVHMRRWYDKKIIAKSVKNGFARAVEVAKLDLSDGNVTPHTLRHTAATWLMQLGTDPWEAAGYLGMSVKVLIDTYGHHHPDYMKEASGAITRKRKTTKRSLAPPRLPSQPSALGEFSNLGRETINLPGGQLAKVRYARIATKFRSAAK